MGGSGDGPDDRSNTGKDERACPRSGVLPREKIPKPCPKLSREQGQADDFCNYRHDHTFLASGRTTTPQSKRNFMIQSNLHWSSQSASATEQKYAASIE
jgi:hypothetical protein